MTLEAPESGQILTRHTILLVIRRNILLVLLTTALVTGAVLAVTLITAPSYESKASFWVQRDRSLVVTQPLNAPPPSQQMMIAMMVSETTRLEMAEQLKLKNNKDFWGSSADEEHDENDLLDRLDEMLDVYEDRQKPIVQLTVKAPTPDLAFSLAQNMMNRVIQRTEDLQSEESKFLDAQVAARRKDFATAVTRLVEFQKKHGIVTDITKQGEAIFTSVLTLREGLTKAQTELAGVDKMLSAPNDPLGQLQLLARKDGLAGSVQYLEEQSREAEQMLDEMPDLGRQYTLLYAEVMIQQELVKQVTITAETAKLEAADEHPKIVILEKPRKPAEPVDELMVRLLLGVVLGFLFGLALAALRETILNLPHGN